VSAARAERQAPLQKKTNDLPDANTGLWYGLSGSSQNSSIPRGQWKAPGIIPSRSSSRTSRRSTKTTSSVPRRPRASSRESVVIRALASSTI
jgi:hypothetical protein